MQQVGFWGRRIAAVIAMVLAFGVAAHAQQNAAQGHHHLVIQVDENDPAKMNLALNNASNVFAYYLEKNEPVEVEIVAYGPGLHIFRDDTSPVKKRLEALKQTYDKLTYSACHNTMKGMEKAEKKPVKLAPEVQVVPAGVTRIMELQEKGWTYIRP
jgi:intracellular sulfur oxidation DsrE/DsrF family protein